MAALCRWLSILAALLLGAVVQVRLDAALDQDQDPCHVFNETLELSGCIAKKAEGRLAHHALQSKDAHC